MEFIGSADVFLFLVQDEGFESGVFESVSEGFAGVNFVGLEKVFCGLVRCVTVPSPSSNSRIYPVHQPVASNSKWPFGIGQNIINISLSFVGKLLPCSVKRLKIRKMAYFNLKFVVDPAVVHEEDKIGE